MKFEDKLAKYALEKYAGDEQQAEQFMEGFMKYAAEFGQGAGDVRGSLFDRMMSSKVENKSSGDDVASTLRKGVSGAIGKGIGDIAIAAGATAVGSVYGSIKNQVMHGKFLQALERAYQTNPILKQTKKERVLQYAETIFKFAPNVATDSNLLSSILANAIHGEGIDPMTIKTLTELENRYSTNNTFSPKTYV